MLFTQKHDLKPPTRVIQDPSNNDPIVVRASILLTRIEHFEHLQNGATQIERDLLHRAKTLIQDKSARWIELRQAERIIFSIMGPDETYQYLIRLLTEDKILDDRLQKYYKDAAKDLEEFRETNKTEFNTKVNIVLNQLAEDLHDAVGKKHRRRWSILKIRQNKSWAFFFSFVVFSTSMALYFLVISQGFLGFEHFDRWTKFFFLISSPAVAIVSGLFGASFSVLQTKEESLEVLSIESLERSAKKGAIFIRLLAGLGGSLILYYFFLSGFLEGTFLGDDDLLDIVIPMIKSQRSASGTDISSESLKSLVRIHAKLAVLCFIAGFSERLIPSVVEQLSGRMATPRPRA